MPRRAQDGDQDVLRVPQRVRRGAEHEDLPGLFGHAWRVAGAQRQSDRANRPNRSRVWRRDSGLFEVRSQELLLSGHAQGLPDLAVRHAANDRRRRQVLAGGRHVEGVPPDADSFGRGHGKIHARGFRRRSHRGKLLFAPRLQSRGGSADGVRLGTGAAQRSRRRRILGIAAQDAARSRGQRRQDGGRLAALRCQRLDAPGRRDAAWYEERDQEHELVSFRRARDRQRNRAPDRDPRVGRARRAGDARLGRAARRHALDAQQGRGARLSLLPRSRSRAARDLARRRRALARRSFPCCRGSASNAIPASTD